MGVHDAPPISGTLQARKGEARRLALRCGDGRERFGAENLQRAGERVAELIVVEADPRAGVVDTVAQGLDLLSERVMPFARGFELFLGNRALPRVERFALDGRSN